MSADNYGIIHKSPNGYGISQFFASAESEENDLSHPYHETQTLGEMIAFANTAYFEYGYSVMDDIFGDTPSSPRTQTNERSSE